MTDDTPEGDQPGGNASGRQLARNFATGYLGLAASVLLSLVLTPVVLNHLHTTDYGLWVLIVTVGTYVGLLGGGVATAAVRLVAVETALGRPDRVAAVLATARLYFLGSGLLAAGLTGAFLPFVGQVFSVSGSDLRATRWGLVLMAGFSVLGFLGSVPGAALTGTGRNDRLSLINMAVNVGTQGAQIAAVLLGGGIVSLLAATAIGSAASWLASERCARQMGFLPRGSAQWSILRDLVRSGARNTTVSLGGTITYGLDAFVIGTILPVRQVAPYDIALSTANLVSKLATTGTNLLLPTYAHASATKDREREFRLFTRAVLASLAMMCPLVIVLIGFGPELLRLWLRGTPPDHTFQILVVMNVAFLFQLPGHQAFVYLTGVGRNALLARIALPLALLNVGLSVLGTFWLGPVGPVAANLPQMVVVDFFLLPLACCRGMGKRLRDYGRAALLPLAAPIAVAAVLTAALRLSIGTSEVAAPVEAVAVSLVALAAGLPVLTRLDPDMRLKLQVLSSKVTGRQARH